MLFRSMLLKVGRHLRPAPHFKLIISREEGENHYLSGYQHDFITIRTLSHRGPVTLIDGKPTGDDLRLAAQITARYSQGRSADAVTCSITLPDGEPEEIVVAPLPEEAVSESWHV